MSSDFVPVDVSKMSPMVVGGGRCFDGHHADGSRIGLSLIQTHSFDKRPYLVMMNTQIHSTCRRLVCGLERGGISLCIWQCKLVMIECISKNEYWTWSWTLDWMDSLGIYGAWESLNKTQYIHSTQKLLRYINVWHSLSVDQATAWVQPSWWELRSWRLKCFLVYKVVSYPDLHDDPTHAEAVSNTESGIIAA